MSIDFTWLAESTYCACRDGAAIFLQLREDRYLGLGAEYFKAAHIDPEEFVTALRDPGGFRVDSQSASLVRSLTDAGLLTSVSGERNSHASLPYGITSTAMDMDAGSRRLSVRGLVRFIWSLGAGYLDHRRGDLRRTISHARLRLKRRASPPQPSRPLAEVLYEFTIFRALTYTSANRCVFDAVVLAYTLSSHGYSPDIVIGVSAQPFRAHCWVQLGNMVINGSQERISRFAPILTV